MQYRVFGWGSKFGTIKCRTTYFGISKFRILKERKMSYSIFYFQIFLNFCICSNYLKTQYMLVYKIGNLWNFDSFRNLKILKICYFSQLNKFRNLTVLKIVRFGKFLEFCKFEIFRIFQIRNFLNFSRLVWNTEWTNNSRIANFWSEILIFQIPKILLC